jgi:catechol-2,3-dioxygenase
LGLAFFKFTVAALSMPGEAAFYWLNFGPAQTLNLSLNPEQTPRAMHQELDWTRTPHLAFSAPEAFLDEVAARLEARGMTSRRSKTGLYFTDPDGNFLEVTCWREQALQAVGLTHW